VSGEPLPRSATPKVLIPFALVTLIWGSTWIVIRDQLGVVPPTWSVSYRFLVAAAVMGGFAAWRGERVPWRDRGFWWLAAATAFTQFCLNFNFVYRAEQYVTSGLVAVAFATLLVPNALMGRLFLGQRLGRQLLAGSAVAMAGVALLFVRELRADPAGTARTAAGLAFTGAAILSASAANVMQATERARRYPVAPLLTVAMLGGALADAALAWALSGPPVIEWRAGYLAGILYLGVFASAVAFTLYFGVLRAIGPAKAAYSSVLVPVIAMALSTAFEGYRWTALAAAGAALTAAGLVIALSARRPAR